MSERFSVIQIREEMIVADEPMGSKDKFWCRLEAGGPKWLFKHPRPEPEKIEHVAEKLAQEIGDLISVPTARIEFAEFKGNRGTISKDVRAPEETLVHGNEIIAGRVTGYDLARRRRTSDHTLERIGQAILEVCEGECEESLRQFAGYLMLDALIGNTDRHHENWALLRSGDAQSIRYRLAPSFDHASSLGREMRDERRLRLIRENRLGKYIREGQGAIFLNDYPETAIAPITLVEMVRPRMAKEFAQWISKMEFVTDANVDAILDRMPDGWISGAQREFAKALICQSQQILSGLNR